VPKKFVIGKYDAQHMKNLAEQARKVQKLMDDAIRKAALAAQSSKTDPAKEFHFSDFPSLNKQVDKLMSGLHDNMQLAIEEGDKDSWNLSNTKNDAIVRSVASSCPGIPKETIAAWSEPHLLALQSFIGRTASGMDLSTRVWNLTGQMKKELELALGVGIGQGKSAAELSRDIRQYLMEPNKLFRRVRDKDGVLRLSKAAKAYHPGAGVYRSSYKNALRMTATENNMAYRTADHNRWSALPFVLGIEIRISNNHPVEDICDELAGRYPKDFKFVGWHPWCRCYAVSILASREEMNKYTEAILVGKDVTGWKFSGVVTECPDEFNAWCKTKKEDIENPKMKNPYFINDNTKYVEKALGKTSEQIPDKDVKNILEHVEAEMNKAAKNEWIEQNRTEVEGFMQKAIEQSDVAMRVNEGSLSAILESGRFKNIYSNGSNGIVKEKNLPEYLAQRKEAEKYLFGTYGKTYYAYLSPKDMDEAASSKQLRDYGNIVIRFKKDDIISRSTWTPNDSLSMYRDRNNVNQVNGYKRGILHPSRMDEQNASMFADENHDRWFKKEKPWEDKNVDARQWMENHYGLYNEVQIHGSLSINEIESVCLPFSLDGAKYSGWKEKAELMKSKGIRVFYKKGKKVIEY
jgi:hypothetical protein